MDDTSIACGSTEEVDLSGGGSVPLLHQLVVLKLRHLQRVLACNVAPPHGCQDPSPPSCLPSACRRCPPLSGYYLSFHETCGVECPAFLTTELQCSASPAWAKLNITSSVSPCNLHTCKGVVVRVWYKPSPMDEKQTSASDPPKRPIDKPALVVDSATNNHTSDAEPSPNSNVQANTEKYSSSSESSPLDPSNRGTTCNYMPCSSDFQSKRLPSSSLVKFNSYESHRSDKANSLSRRSSSYCTRKSKCNLDEVSNSSSTKETATDGRGTSSPKLPIPPEPLNYDDICINRMYRRNKSNTTQSNKIKTISDSRQNPVSRDGKNNPTTTTTVGTSDIINLSNKHSSNNSESIMLFSWAVYFSGLVPIGTNLSQAAPHLKPNTLVFQLTSDMLYTAADAVVDQVPGIEPSHTWLWYGISLPMSQTKRSYSPSTLTKLHQTERDISILEKRCEERKERLQYVSNISSDSKQRILQNRISAVSSKVRLARTLVKRERDRLAELRDRVDETESHNQEKGMQLLCQLQQLGRERQQLRSVCSYGELQVQQLCRTRALLAHRRSQLITDLAHVYPILQISAKDEFSISNIWVPDAQLHNQSNLHTPNFQVNTHRTKPSKNSTATATHVTSTTTAANQSIANNLQLGYSPLPTESDSPQTKSVGKNNAVVGQPYSNEPTSNHVHHERLDSKGSSAGCGSASNDNDHYSAVANHQSTLIQSVARRSKKISHDRDRIGETTEDLSRSSNQNPTTEVTTGNSPQQIIRNQQTINTNHPTTIGNCRQPNISNEQIINSMQSINNSNQQIIITKQSLLFKGGGNVGRGPSLLSPYHPFPQSAFCPALPHSNESLSAGLGMSAHLLCLVSSFLQVPLRYPMSPAGSMATVTDVASTQLPHDNRKFPLYTRGKERERLHFNYAVFLVNKNLTQLHHYLALPKPASPSATLANLHAVLIHLIRSDRPLSEVLPDLRCQPLLTSNNDLRDNLLIPSMPQQVPSNNVASQSNLVGPSSSLQSTFKTSTPSQSTFGPVTSQANFATASQSYFGHSQTAFLSAPVSGSNFGTSAPTQSSFGLYSTARSSLGSHTLSQLGLLRNSGSQPSLGQHSVSQLGLSNQTDSEVGSHKKTPHHSRSQSFTQTQLLSSQSMTVPQSRSHSNSLSHSHSLIQSPAHSLSPSLSPSHCTVIKSPYGGESREGVMIHSSSLGDLTGSNSNLQGDATSRKHFHSNLNSNAGGDHFGIKKQTSDIFTIPQRDRLGSSSLTFSLDKGLDHIKTVVSNAKDIEIFVGKDSGLSASGAERTSNLEDVFADHADKSTFKKNTGSLTNLTKDKSLIVVSDSIDFEDHNLACFEDQTTCLLRSWHEDNPSHYTGNFATCGSTEELEEVGVEVTESFMNSLQPFAGVYFDLSAGGVDVSNKFSPAVSTNQESSLKSEISVKGGEFVDKSLSSDETNSKLGREGDMTSIADDDDVSQPLIATSAAPEDTKQKNKTGKKPHRKTKSRGFWPFSRSNTSEESSKESINSSDNKSSAEGFENDERQNQSSVAKTSSNACNVNVSQTNNKLTRVENQNPKTSVYNSHTGTPNFTSSITIDSKVNVETVVNSCRVNHQASSGPPTNIGSGSAQSRLATEDKTAADELLRQSLAAMSKDFECSAALSKLSDLSDVTDRTAKLASKTFSFKMGAK